MSDQTEITKAQLAEFIMDEEISIDELEVIIKETLDVPIPKGMTRDELENYTWEHFVKMKDDKIEENEIIKRPREIDPTLNRTEFIKLLIREGGNSRADIINEVAKTFYPNEMDKTKPRRRVGKVINTLRDEGIVKVNKDKSVEWIGE